MLQVQQNVAYDYFTLVEVLRNLVRIDYASQRVQGVISVSILEPGTGPARIYPFLNLHIFSTEVGTVLLNDNDNRTESSMPYFYRNNKVMALGAPMAIHSEEGSVQAS